MPHAARLGMGVGGYLKLADNSGESQAVVVGFGHETHGVAFAFEGACLEGGGGSTHVDVELLFLWGAAAVLLAEEGNASRRVLDFWTLAMT